jgi:hypothetical protein
MERTRTIKNVSLEAVNDLLNGDNVELLEVLEGSLLDNYLIYCHNNGNLVLCTETYLNEWSSCYTVIYGNYDKVYAKFEKFENEYRQMIQDIEETYKNRQED